MAERLHERRHGGRRDLAGENVVADQGVGPRQADLLPVGQGERPRAGQRRPRVFVAAVVGVCPPEVQPMILVLGGDGRRALVVVGGLAEAALRQPPVAELRVGPFLEWRDFDLLQQVLLRFLPAVELEQDIGALGVGVFMEGIELDLPGKRRQRLSLSALFAEGLPDSF